MKKSVTKNNHEKKPFQLGIRFTRKDEKLIKKAIKKSRLATSDWGRRAILHAAHSRISLEAFSDYLRKQEPKFGNQIMKDLR